MIFLIIWIVCGILGAVIGSNKGVGCLGAILGFVLGPLGLLIVVVTPDETRVECPFCREKINKAAVVCPHCRNPQQPGPGKPG